MQKRLLNIKKLAKELFLFTSRPDSVQRACFYCTHFQKNPYQPIRKIIIVPISRTDDEWFFLKSDFKLLLSNRSMEFFHDNFLDEYKARNASYFNSWLAVCKKVNNIFSRRADNKALTSVINEYFAYPLSSNSYFYFSLSVWFFDQEVAPKYEETLKNFFREKFDCVWEIVISQTEFTEDQRMRLEIAKLKQKFGNSINSQILSKFQDKYRYIGIYAPEDYGFTLEDIQKMYSDINVADTLSIQQYIEHNKKEFEKIKLGIKDKRILQIIEQINYNVYFRTIRSERISYGFALVNPMYEYLANKLDRSRTEVGNLTNEEIIEYISEGKIPPKRTERPAMYFEDGKPIILSEAQVKEFKSMFSSNGKHEQLNGSVAYGGKVRGRVKVITSVDDLSKVEIGDILVSQFTRPEYLSAMQKASAFITNDGGITCHAAIVAREVKKPCIVGTKIATKVLKDGDLVEVDANKGVVKILKKLK